MGTYTNFIGLKSSTSQTINAGGVVALGSIYRKFITRCAKGLDTFVANGTSVSLQHSGFYKVTAVVTFTAPVAGNITLQFAENGVPITGASATETITTATTETRTITLDYLFVVSKGYVDCTLTTLIKNISLINASTVAVNISNIVFDVVKL